MRELLENIKSKLENHLNYLKVDIKVKLLNDTLTIYIISKYFTYIYEFNDFYYTIKMLSIDSNYIVDDVITKYRKKVLSELFK